MRIDLGRQAEILRLPTVDHVSNLMRKAYAVSERPGDESGYHDIIEGGTKRLVDVALVAGVKCFVYMSGVESMGEGNSPPCSSGSFDERHQPEPSTPYGRAKL